MHIRQERWLCRCRKLKVTLYHSFFKVTSLVFTADFNSLERKGVAKFGDLLINDHQAASQFKCIQFMAAMNRQKNVGTTSGDPIDAFTLDDSNEQNTKFDVEVKLGKPQLELYKLVFLTFPYFL
jgi:hypothetical protein